MYKDMISVIVPVYNVEKYLEKCLNSLVNQTYKNIEIIVVDDGATDGSGEIADGFALKYDFVKVIHTKNGGLSAARNVGLENASGEYIAFVDSDDWVDLNTFEQLHKLIIKGDYGFASCGLSEEFGTETGQNFEAVDYNSCDQKVLFNLILTTKYVCGYACNKLFKRENIGDLRFDEKLLSCEDIDFCSKFASKCRSAIYTKAPFYHYRQRTDSMTGDFGYNARKLSVIKAYEKIMPIYTEYDPEDLYIAEKNYLKINLNIKGRMILSGVDDPEVADMLNSNIEEYYPRVMKNGKNSLLTKLNIAFTKRYPALLLKIKQYILSRKRGLKND